MSKAVTKIVHLSVWHRFLPKTKSSLLHWYAWLWFNIESKCGVGDLSSSSIVTDCEWLWGLNVVWLVLHKRKLKVSTFSIWGMRMSNYTKFLTKNMWYRSFSWDVASPSRGQESGSVFSAAVCKIQASKCYIKSSPLVAKDKRSCFSQGERSAIQLPLDCAFALWK